MALELLYFTASYCAPCKALKPQVEQYAAKNNIQLKIVDIQENRDLANLYEVTVVPVLAVVDGSNKKVYHGKTKIEIFLNTSNILPQKEEFLQLLIKGAISAVGGYITTRLLTKFFSQNQ